MKHKSRFFFVLDPIILLGICACSLVLYDIFLSVDREDPDAVASAFMYSLRDNNARKARLLTSPERRTQIDAWITQHEVVQCPFSFDMDDWETSDEDHEVLGENVIYFSYYSSMCPRNGYKFTVEDIVLQHTKKGYLVVDWSKPCEKMNWDWWYEPNQKQCE